MAIEGKRLPHLPKYIFNKPDVRGQTLSVYKVNEHYYQVPGRQKVYDVYIIDNEIHCTCQAASFGNKCAHAVAVKSALHNTATIATIHKEPI